MYMTEILIKEKTHAMTGTRVGLHFKRNFLRWKGRPFFLPLTSAVGRFLHVDRQSKGMMFPFFLTGTSRGVVSTCDFLSPYKSEYAFAYKGEKHDFATYT